MNQLDVYYRALLEYRHLTLADHDCSALRTAISNADAEKDKIVVVRSLCTIDNDWVDAIENGLLHIEKAINENRQFIRSNGTVVPIEKVKNVSRESVEHLAKHSNLITRYTEGEDIIPDKLYTVERLSEYAVYENRFLYMLLSYLRDFVTIRYNEILDLTNKYDATVDFDKKISVGKQKLAYTLSMHDVRRDDPFLKENNPAKETIDRIDLILKTVIAYLSTPLMEEVAKSPMLKPPITKTNVLKMNKHFKGAVALYDFIVSYDKAGYTIEKQTDTIAPFGADLADELAEAGGLVAFLTYEYGLGLKRELQKSYAREEERRKLEKIRQRNERIEALKRRLNHSEISIEEYVITLEEQLRDLESVCDHAEKLTEELDAEKALTKRLSETVEKYGAEIESLNLAMENLKQEHFEEIQRIHREHEDAMHELIVKHENAMHELTVKHAQETARLVEEHNDEIQKMNDEAKQTRERHEEELRKTQHQADEELQRVKSELNLQIEDMRNQLAASSEELSDVKEEYLELMEAKRLTEARLKSYSGISVDATDRESFNELEREYQAFTRVYKEHWKITKNNIKKKHLNMNNLKGQKEKKEEETSDSD